MHNQYLNEAISNILSRNTIFIDEALAASAHKAMATKAANDSKDASGATASEQISKHVMSADRELIPLERTSTPSGKVLDHLKSNGYSIAGDYKEGLASHSSSPTRKIKIGKVLSQTGAPEGVKAAFEKDPARQGIKSETKASVLISRRPSDVAAMSTHQSWDSCLALGGKAKNSRGEEVVQKPGVYKEKIPGIIKSGSHVAYLVNHPDDVDKHYKPIARTALNVFTSKTSNHKILRPSEEYGDSWEGFHHTVKKWAEKNFPAKDPEYTLHKDTYQEGETSIRDYSPKHDNHWINHGDEAAHKSHPNPHVLDKIVDKEIAERWSGTNFNNLLHNPKLPQESHDKIADEMAPKEETALAVTHSKKVTASFIKGSHNVQKMLDKNPDNLTVADGASKNKDSTPAQLHHMLDHHAITNNDDGTKSVKSTTSWHDNQIPKEIIKNVIRNPNSNDTHFKKILGVDEYNHTDQHSKMRSNENNSHELEEISSKYHSEDIGKKLISSLSDHNGLLELPRVVSNVAEKHPHLISTLSHDAIETTYHRFPENKNLETETIRRGAVGHGGCLNALAQKSSDRNLLNNLSNHPHKIISDNAKNRLKFLDMYKE